MVVTHENRLPCTPRVYDNLVVYRVNTSGAVRVGTVREDFVLTSYPSRFSINQERLQLAFMSSNRLHIYM